MAIGPLVFEPYLRPQIWGGRALGDRFSKKLPTDEPYGESWEISAHPHHVSVVAEGELKGKTLAELCENHAVELFGKAIPEDGKFPLLIKLLDCHELLSVQVHPDDAKAAKLLKDEKGKTEAWVVVDSKPAGLIYAGLRPGVDRTMFEQHMESKTTGECLHSFHPKAGDCVFIPAGTVHTMGGGVLIAEVQQSSDATFRIFDWNRLDKNGQSRPLHLAESLAAIDFDKGPVAPVVPDSRAEAALGVAEETLVDCPFFNIERYKLAGPLAHPYQGKLVIWMVLDGEALLVGQGYNRLFRRGETVLVPASSPALVWEPTEPANFASLLAITLPEMSAD
jgi:mannose-6-phosphate isomerase